MSMRSFACPPFPKLNCLWSTAALGTTSKLHVLRRQTWGVAILQSVHCVPDPKNNSLLAVLVRVSSSCCLIWLCDTVWILWKHWNEYAYLQIFSLSLCRYSPGHTRRTLCICNTPDARPQDSPSSQELLVLLGLLEQSQRSPCKPSIKSLTYLPPSCCHELYIYLHCLVWWKRCFMCVLGQCSFAGAPFYWSACVDF